MYASNICQDSTKANVSEISKLLEARILVVLKHMNSHRMTIGDMAQQ
jgi:hypothetical protein